MRGSDSPRDKILQLPAAFHEGQSAQVLAPERQQVIDADGSRILADELGTGRFAVEPFLQIGERPHPALRNHKQLSVETGIEGEQLYNIGKRP